MTDDLNFYEYYEDQYYEEQYQKFLAEHGKSYPTEEEYNLRFGMFTKNLQFIEAHDPEVEGHTVGLNEMSDWTDEEFGVVSGRSNVKAHKERMAMLGA